MIIYLFIGITLIYLFLIGSISIAFDKVRSFPLKDIDPKTTFSVIIPFRNEAKNLPNLLESLQKLQYSKHLFEVILVNDASEDHSVSIIKEFLLKRKTSQPSVIIMDNIRTSNSPKKDAITSAINIAKQEWIITTDADCILPEFWLDTYDAFIQQNETEFIVAPVTYHSINSFLDRFQLLDFLSLQGATIGTFGLQKPFLCNGANMGYKKSLFKTLNGFDGNTNIASGDDIFLLEKAMRRTPKNVHYLKSEKAVVLTKSQASISSLISQRVRWASKTARYQNNFAKIIGLIVLLMNASLVGGFVLSIVSVLSYKALLYLFLIKSSIDFLLLFKASRFYNQESYLSSFLFSSILYPFFSIYIAFFSTFTKYKWKGRAFSK